MFAILFLFSLTFILPFIWLIINSFKTSQEFSTNYAGLPINWTFENFVNAFTFASPETHYFNVFQMLGMSLLLSVCGTLATVFFSSCAAYVVAKYEFPGRKIIFGIVIFTLIIPIVGSLPSQIQLMQKMGLYDTIIGVIFLYSGAFGMNFMLLYSFFKNLSWTYVEAAKIDGASDFRIFFQIILPMAKGPVIAISVIALIGLWNDYMTPKIFLQSMPTIAVGLELMSNTMTQAGSYTLLFATIIIALIPIIIMFCFFSKTIMQNTAVGGLKG